MRFLINESTNSQSEQLQERVDRLEKQIEKVQQQLDQLVKENQTLKRDMRFFEFMLLEEYHLLIQLLGKDQNNLRIHQTNPSP